MESTISRRENNNNQKIWAESANILSVSNTFCRGFYPNPLMGVLATFSTGTYAIISTTCVKSETCNEKYHEKNGPIPTVNEILIFSYLFSDHEGRITAMLTQNSDQIRWPEKICGVLQNVFQDLEKKPENVLAYESKPPNLPQTTLHLFYILTSVKVLRTPNAGQNLHFQHFFC